MTDAVAPLEALGTAGSLSRSTVTKVGIATVLSALCAYAVLYLAARNLGPAGFSVFGVFWGAFGLCAGASYGLLQEAAREVRWTVHARATVGPRTRPMLIATGVGAAASAGIAGTAPLWAEQLFTASTGLSTTLLAVGLAGFCLHATLLGILAGAGSWTQYGWLLVADAAIRVAVAVAAFLLGWGLAGFLWATVAGSIAWLLLLAASGAARGAAAIRTAGTVLSFLRGASHSIAAAAASAVLVMGFPVLLKATSGDLGAAGGVVILAVTLTRTPLLVPLTAMQGNLIAHFVDHASTQDTRLRALLIPAGIVVGVGAVGVLAAGLVGPWLLWAAFGPEYQTGGALLAWLTAGAVSVALLTLTGAATVAAALHRAYSFGWVGATVAAAALLTLPLDLQTRTVIALICGPLVGIAVHTAALARSG